MRGMFFNLGLSERTRASGYRNIFKLLLNFNSFQGLLDLVFHFVLLINDL